MDEKQKSVLLSEVGYEAAEEILNVTDLYDPREQWASYLINAIKAKELFLKDVTYIVRGQEVLIVDEFTGRVMQVILDQFFFKILPASLLLDPAVIEALLDHKRTSLQFLVTYYEACFLSSGFVVGIFLNLQGRRWSDGLHQAVEAKEGVKIQNETVTLASISYQNFFLQVLHLRCTH